MTRRTTPSRLGGGCHFHDNAEGKGENFASANVPAEVVPAEEAPSAADRLSGKGKEVTVEERRKNKRKRR